MQSGELNAAEEAFHRVLAMDPQSGAAYANLGVVAMRRKNWDEALKNLKKAERLSPKMIGVRLNIGLVEFHRQNYAEAIPPFESVVREERSSTQARYLLGLCQLFTERYAAAAQTLEPLWDQMSGDVLYLYVLGIAANSAGEPGAGRKGHEAATGSGRRLSGVALDSGQGVPAALGLRCRPG